MTVSIDPTPAARPQSPTRRGRRAVACGIAAAGLALMLSACDKPQPSVTVFNGSTAKAVQAQQPCVFTGACNPDGHKIGDLSAVAGSTILIDVPKNLAAAGWVAAAFTQDSSGKNTPVPGAGTPGTSKDLTSRTRVPDGTGGYFLQVSALKPSNQLTTWIVRVSITG